jgi:hypothetical protein
MDQAKDERWACPAGLYDRWHAALASGRYGWTLDMLRTATGHSPVGVLLDVYADGAGWEQHPKFLYWRWQGMSHGPPDAVRELIGFTHRHQFLLRKLAEACGGHGALAARLGDAVVRRADRAVPVAPPPEPAPKKGARRPRKR